MRPFSREERKALFDGKQVSSLLPYDDIDGNAQVLDIIREGNGRLSISGAQEKFAMVEDGGCLRFTRKGERGKYILKPVPTDYRFYLREDMPANEYLTMHIARKVYHLLVAAHGLVFFGSGQTAYLTRRFDYLADGSKAGMEDLASIAGLNASTSGSDYKYHLSYEDCAGWIKRYCPAYQVDLLRFFRLIIFNYLFCNADAHLKNFSLKEDGTGFYRLAPAYDLLNTQIHLPTSIFALEKGLFKEGTPILDTTPIGRPLFEQFGRRIALPEETVQRELDDFALVRPEVDEMIGNSLLSDKAKEDYLASYKYRLSTMQK